MTPTDRRSHDGVDRIRMAPVEQGSQPYQLNTPTLLLTKTIYLLAGSLLTLSLCACVYRPLPHRLSVDELVQQSLNRSKAYHTGDENYVQSDLDVEHVIYEQELPQSVEMVSPQVPMTEQLPRIVGSGASLDDAPVVYDDEPRITEEFIETDVREVLTMVTAETGLDLVLDDNVGGIVNTQINDLPVDQAIEKILMPLGYAFIRRGNQVIVAPADASSPLFSFVAVKREYRPLHQDSETLLDTVPSNWVDYVTQVEKAKLLLVEAPQRIADDIIQRFMQIDQPVPQVVLEAIICVVSPDSGFQFGLDWEHAVNINDAKALAFGASGLAVNGSISKSGIDQVFSDFSSTSAFVKLLSEHGYLTIRASPHVMAKDGEKANIAINRETFFSVQPQGSNANNSVIFQQDVQKVDSGITLDITPHIRGNVVTVDIEKAEVSEDVRATSSELSVNQFPIINRRSVSTTVSVKNGKTIVIGGLVQRETVDRVNRVPGLSRLPGVGYLFQTTERQTRDAEVVIFLSPRIIDSSATANITLSGS